MSVSTVDIPALNVLGGVYVRAKWDLLGLRKDIAFRLEPGVGVEFYVVYDVSELSRVRVILATCRGTVFKVPLWMTLMCVI